ncbi:unnamed protein product, partial [Linum tenue]
MRVLGWSIYKHRRCIELLLLALQSVYESVGCSPFGAEEVRDIFCSGGKVDPILSIKLDVFCSESGEWIKDAVVHDDHVRSKGGLVSWNGELLWVYRHYLSPDFGLRPLVAVFDPFRLDVPPTSIDVPSSGKLAVSQDALHAIVQDKRKGRPD